MAMAINYNNDDEDSMALFPFGSSSGFGSFGSGCYHPHLPSPTDTTIKLINYSMFNARYLVFNT
uniref:Uncharacterized protein n=1 Tax=Cucumis melo TaxID=3656 RepID=A0A9I9E6L6_CUCME